MSNSLLLDLYELTMAQSFFVHKKHMRATFDLFVRKLPKNRSYLVCAGLESILDYIKNLSFKAEDINYLRKQKLFSPRFLRYLRNFKFSGDVWAMPEGTIFFAGEPIIRVTGSIIEAQILESFLLNSVNLQTMIASKASRVVCSAKKRATLDFSLRRTHGADAAIKVARSSYIAGFSGTSNVLAGKLYGIPIVGTMAHSFIMSFKLEKDSFLAYSHTFPEKTTLLVDTYDTKKGIENAIAIGINLREKGYKLQAIRLDSGDIVNLSKMARNMLDNAGLKYVKIIASGNLDEFKIEGLLKKGAKVDCFGVGTNMGTSVDAPNLDVIYKICEVTDEGGKFLSTMKISKDKVTFPGRKQIFRVRGKNGVFIKDILGLEEEKIRGAQLLKKTISSGRLLHRRPALGTIRQLVQDDLSGFSAQLRNVSCKYKYPVIISPGLNKIRQSLMHQLKNRQ